ncbi:MAG: restriction endonuclease [Aquisalinus sp.]|nr:restriction endonuclease [Aquisalinus sp.]
MLDQLKSQYEIISFRNAEEVLESSFAAELSELTEALTEFKMSVNDLRRGGGNESAHTKRFKSLMNMRGWNERRLTADLIVKTFEDRKKANPVTEEILEGFLDGHNIDFVKGRVAVEWEWNSKDQTFDRDLIAFRAFFESNVIDVGVIVTRSASLNPVFRELGIMTKYGASTTWIGKLIPRINAGRNGGCPILCIGITPNIFDDIGNDDV